MKNIFKFWLAAVAVAVGAGVTSCSDDDFTASIFDTNPAIDYLDKSSYTFPLDTFCKKEFLEPYNLKFIYRFEDKGSDMNKNLTPPDYVSTSLYSPSTFGMISTRLLPERSSSRPIVPASFTFVVPRTTTPLRVLRRSVMPATVSRLTFTT